MERERGGRTGVPSSVLLPARASWFGGLVVTMGALLVLASILWQDYGAYVTIPRNRGEAVSLLIPSLPGLLLLGLGLWALAWRQTAAAIMALIVSLINLQGPAGDLMRGRFPVHLGGDPLTFSMTIARPAGLLLVALGAVIVLAQGGPGVRRVTR